MNFFIQTISQFRQWPCGLWVLAFLVVGPAEAARAVYPLKICSNARHLGDQTGAPFLITADTGWHLFYKLMLDEADEYLADRAKKGSNAV